jgi:uncharacterized OsmC-like protein
VLVIRAIHVRYHLQLEDPDERTRAAVERVHGFHRDHCPVARTLKGCVAISTELHLE